MAACGQKPAAHKTLKGLVPTEEKKVSSTKTQEEDIS